MAPAGQMERARANLAALQALRTLEAEGRAATAEEQRVLARWSGWGALPLIFGTRPAREAYDSDAAHERAAARWESFDGIREQVRALLSDSEWAAARRNTLNAHYTDAALVQAIWSALRELDFNGGRVLEPGSGSGNFIGFAPQDTARPVRMTGVEVEPTTAAISRYLYPDAEVITSGLEGVPLPDGAYDAVVGNVPFGKYARFDKVHNPDLKLSIHDHFVLKSLAATRPGGVVAVITSRYTLDSKDAQARERMYQLGDLVGAVRLPAQAHRAAAGTDVVTDVLFLRRRAEGEEPGDATWLLTPERVLPGHDQPVGVNAYFETHPDHVLGELRTRIGQFGPELTVEGRGGDPAAELTEAAADIAAQARTAAPAPTASGPVGGPVVLAHGAAEYALGLDEAGNPTIVDGGRVLPLEVHPEQRDKLIQLIRLKAQTQALYEAEAATAEPGETPELARLRGELREAYRAYRRSNPPLAKPRQPYKFIPRAAKKRAAREGLASVPEEWKPRTAYAFINDDPDASLLFGLEEWDDKTGTATEQQVLLSRVLEPRRLPTRAQNPEDAIAIALEYDGGRLDMARVADLLGVDEETAAAQVGHAGLAFRDPGQTGVWEPRHRYLSGNVRTKLAQARQAAAEDPSYAGNVAALERVQPDDLAPSEIKAKIGAPWIPVDVYNDFLHHLGFEEAEVKHAGGTVWEVRGARFGDLARSEWGTAQRPAQELFLALLRQTDSLVTVTHTDSEGRTFVDQEATDEAREKARLIAEAFEDWVWADEDRAARLAGLYNEQFNNLVLPEYSNAPLTLPGLIKDWQMRPHQNAAIRRILTEPTALLAHVVGAGKTATMAAGAMELRRTGLAKKPCIVVPNHMLKQWSREFRQLYPNAKILAISASDLSKRRRAKFMARIAGGEWDAVILTHEAFNRVPLRAETQRAYLDQEMSSMRAQVDAAAEAGMDSRTVKQVETALANAEARLQKQIDQTSEVGVFLEDTGVDYLFLDEAHEYKNLRTVSAVPGAAIEGSAKATKLHMVLSWLRETNTSERVATLATGTPIANSVTEAYVLMRYLAPQLLEDMGLDAFDNWASTFGEVVSALEPDPKGNGYRYKARFSRFFNVPELMVGYRTFADVQMAEDLKLPTPPVRTSTDGQRGETVLIPATGAQREFIQALPNQPWVNKPGGVLKALGEGLRASLDMRLVGGEEEQGSKLSYAAEKIAEIWRETKDTVYPVSRTDPTPQDVPGGLQLVFLDEGTPGSSAKHGENLYADLRDKLTDLGLPRDSIRFIHEANTDRKKEKLFADCRAGRVCVLIGSTQKMGTGTNVQSRAVALHHLSYPWRPADMGQRDGRIERQGNLNAPWIDGTPNDVRILYYVTERTFDEFRLNTLARKARFISQIQRREFSLREIEDIGAEALNLGMLSALASGDPAILQFAEATAERVRLHGLARTWDRQQDARAQQIADLDAFLDEATRSLEGMRAALPARRPTAGDAFAMTVDGRTFRKREQAAAALGARMVTLARDPSLKPGQRVPVGSLGGLDFHAETSYDAGGRRQLKLRFGWGHVVPLGHRDDRAQWQSTSVTQDTGRGAIQSLERFLRSLEDDIDKLDTEVVKQRGNREETAGNLRPKEENPYRTQARSKEREERVLGQLVIANEKEALLAERVERAGEHATDDSHEELARLREEIAQLRQALDSEHAIQEQAQEHARSDRRPDTATGAVLQDAAAAPPTASEVQPVAETPAVPRPEAAATTGDASGAAPAEDPQPVQEEQPAGSPTPVGEGAVGDTPLTMDGQDAPQPAPVPTAAPEVSPALTPALHAPGIWAEAVQELTEVALGEELVAWWARANDMDTFAPVLASWMGEWVTLSWDDEPLDQWPDWVRAYLSEDAVSARDSLHAEVAGAVYGQLRQAQREASVPAPAAPAADIPGTPENATASEDTGPDTTPQEQPSTPEAAAPPVTADADTPSPAAETDEAAMASPQMAKSAAILRYYEPLLQRHGLSGTAVADYIDRPGYGYTYDPDSPLPDLVARIGRVGERLAGVVPRDYRTTYFYSVGEERGRAGEQLMHLAISLTSVSTGGEPLESVDLDAILAAPPGTVITLPPEPEPTARNAPPSIVIHHSPEGTTVHGTQRDDRQVQTALRSNGFRFSRRQTMWYQRRDTPFDERDDAVQGLRAVLDRNGVAYTYNGPEPEPELEAASDTPEESRAETAVDESSAAAAGPAEREAQPAPDAQPGSPEEPTAAVEETAPTAQLGLFTPSEPDASSVPQSEASGPDSPRSEADSQEPAPDVSESGTSAESADTAADSQSTDPEDAAGDAAEDTLVQTPDGPGTVIGRNDDLVLVSTEAGTRVYEREEVQWPGDSAPEANPETAARERRNAEDLAQAATAEGIVLRHTDGNRLRDLDAEAGHGTVVDADDTVIGWVRARTGDDGRRYWWAQDAAGGPPSHGPFHENLPASAGVPAIRAAARIRTSMPMATEPEARRPIASEYAAREIQLTTAQVRELRQLTLTGTYLDGTPVETPEWRSYYRRYTLTVAQMRALREAARAAADAMDDSTPEQRRTIRVLRNAVDRLDFEQYDTGRERATISPIGEPDPYAGPYRPQPQTEAPPTEPTGPAAAPGDTAGAREDDVQEQDASPAAAPDAPDDGTVLETIVSKEQEAPTADTEPDIVAAAREVAPAPYWREADPESDEQAAERFGGPHRMREFAARATVLPLAGGLTTTFAQVWMDGRMIGRVIDLNDIGDPSKRPDAPSLWEAAPVFGFSDRRLTRFRSQEAALADLVVQAVRAGPPDPGRLDDAVTASFTQDLARPWEGLAELPQQMWANTVAVERRAELVAVLHAFAEGRSHSGNIADDLVTVHDSLLWLRDAQPAATVQTSDLEKRASAAAYYLNVFRPEDPRAAHHHRRDSVLPTPAAAPDSAAAAGQEPTAAPSEAEQLDLFPAETAPAEQTPAPAPRRRRTRTQLAPAEPPGPYPNTGRLGVYGHADRGECDRCGTPDTDRYVMVWHWYGRDETSGDMAAQCAPCVEITAGVPAGQAAQLADLADARRDGRRIELPARDYSSGDIVMRRTGENEWTSVHRPTGQRYRTAKESESSYRGYVTRDLHGVSYGAGPGVTVGYDVAERAALGRTAETHPSSGDDWTYFAYRQALGSVVLHDGEHITEAERSRQQGAFLTGPLWDMVIDGDGFVVEMVYQQGHRGSDGYRLSITGPDEARALHESWDGALEWAREHARTARAEQPATLVEPRAPETESETVAPPDLTAAAVDEVSAEPATAAPETTTPPLDTLDAAETTLPEPTLESPLMTDPAVEAPTTPPDGGAAPPQPEELPLWTGPELPREPWREENGVLYDAQGAPQWKRKEEPAAAEPPAGAESAGDVYEPVDIFEAFRPVEDAWAEIVPQEAGTTDDLHTALDERLRALQESLQQQWERTAPTSQAPATPNPEPVALSPATGQAGGRDAQRDAEAANTALRQADAHAAVLEDFPEWQELQTVRGAARNLWNALKAKAGDYFDRLWGDRRVQEFWRTVSIRTCEKIADWAQAALDRLQHDDKGHDLPSTEALLNLGDAALAYSEPRRARPGSPPAADSEVSIPEMQKLGAALQRPGVSAAAARGRSTTTRGAPRQPAASTGEQAGHLRRPGNEQQHGRKPTR